MQNVLNLWGMRNITLEGKIIIFKALALSKIEHLTLITSFSKQLIGEMQRIQMPSFGTTGLRTSNIKLCVTLLMKKVVSKILT